LGAQIALDPRFPIAVVQNLFQSLIGEAPMDFPADPGDGSYAAWQAQDSTLRAVSQAFVADNFNFKTAIVELVKSPYFRGINTGATSSARLLQLAGVGTGRLLSPELLARKVEQVFGVDWLNGERVALLSDYRILYGGIDSESVTERLTVPNGMMSAIAWRLATEMACRGVPRDFARGDGLLFPEVDLDTVPENEIAEPIAANVTRIENNLAYLYERLLGQRFVPGSAEAERVYGLFLTTWREGRAKLASDAVGRDLNWECQYRREPGQAEDLPEGEQLIRDENYVIRSWMAVISYLVSDYHFLYD
jgi:hypothetical protein